MLRPLVWGKPRHEALKRIHERFRNLDQTKPLSDYSFVVLDTELTGMTPSTDEIVSIGAVRIRDFCVQPSECFYSLIQPRDPMPKKSTLIHRITPEEVKTAPRLRTVLPDLIEFLNGSLIVGHHIGLDMSFLNRASRRVFRADIINPCLDTMRLAQAYQAEMWENYYDRFQLNVSYNLRDLANRFGLPVFPQHNAMQDALQTAYLFLFLVKKLNKGGVSTLKDLYMVGRSWRWYL
ncbi:MAG: 3'-5' exonuclease [Desulfovibrio sp.]|nr:MAG: 3'-5' exonuclease [Desulfovibrio sp.]